MNPGAQPNVLWILCDELRADAIGSYRTTADLGPEVRTPEVRTPHMDRIAEAGVRFDECWASSPVCVSSRTAMLSGRLPTRTGIFHNEGRYLTPEVPVESFVRRLGDVGYETVSLGKEHVPPELKAFATSDSDGAEQFEMMRVTWDHPDELGEVVHAIGLHAATWPSGRAYPPRRLTEAAVGWLTDRRPRDQPWLLRVSYLQPHTPVVVPEPWASRYDNELWPSRLGPAGGLSDYERAFAAACGSAELSPGQIATTHARYHGLVSWIDDQVGAVLDALKATGELERTIVVFTSDHGAQLGESGGAYGKMTFARHSHRVPMIISWPGTLTEGEVRADLAAGVDLAATVLDLCGVEPFVESDGRSLFSDPAPTEVVSAIGYGNPGGRALAMLDRGDFPGGLGWPQRMCVRTERWRYDRSTRRDGEVLAPPDQDPFLADTWADPAEDTNLVDVGEHRAVVAQLEGILANHLATATQTDPERYEHWRAARDRRLSETWSVS